MRLIVLESMTLSAFRCFADKVTIEFPVGGLIYLTGTNNLDPSLGSNGSGKSTIIDAISWCLYGVSIRGQRASDLATWDSKARPHVVLQYLIDGEEQIIDRTGSPDTLLINGVAAPQSAVDALLGLSRLRFVHSVVFGQAAPLFMDLTVPARGELLSEIMDLDYWDSLTEFASNKVKQLTDLASTTKTQIASDTGRLENMIEQLERMHQDEQTWQDTHDDTVNKTWVACEGAESALVAATSHMNHLQRKPVVDLTKLSAEVEGLRKTTENLRVDHTKVIESHRHVMADIALYHDHKTCPTCKQPLDRSLSVNYEQESIRLRTLGQEIKAEWTEYGIATEQASEDLRRATQLRQDQMIEIQNARVRVETCQHNLTRAQADLATAQSTVNPYTHRIDDMLNQTDEIQARIDTFTAKELRLQADLVKANYWRRTFPRVKLFLIRRVLKMLEIETAAAAASLGVGDWQITFATEAETKSGTTRPGVHISAINPRQQGDYRSYSFGEAQRVKLAVSLGLASLIQSLSGVYFSIEMFDETTAWLSQEGIDDLIGCLDARAESTGKTVWLIDHRSFMYPFAETWSVTKDVGTTTVNRIQ